MLSNRRKTVLYTGVTSDLLRRVYEHKTKQIKGFTSRYNCDRLVWFEQTIDITAAIAREKQIKAGSRKRKEALIAAMNPTWDDLATDWYEDVG